MVRAASAELAALRAEMAEMAKRAKSIGGLVQIGEEQPNIAAVRRLLAARDQGIRDLEALFVQLCEKNQEIHSRGQEYIEQLEREIKARRPGGPRYYADALALFKRAFM
jgi:hypothetical protein